MTREFSKIVSEAKIPNKPFSLLVKPVSADCNLRCPYCFYIRASSLYPETNCHRMSDKVLQQIISTYMKTEQPEYVFGWQGGEPTLMGVEFFQRVTQLQRKFGRSGSLVGNGMQTNVVLIDDEFAVHLSKHYFLVGVSIDGPKKIHNRYRISASGSGTHAETLKGINCLRRNHVEFNSLTLVTSANVQRGREVYCYLRDMEILYHQYIPCIEFDSRGEPLEFSIRGKEWGDFLCEVFDEWIHSDTHRVSIRLFDSIISLMVYGVCTICHMADDCCQYFVVEYNGDVYPCDFFVTGSRKLGNITHNSWAELHKSSKYAEFGRQKAMWNNLCSQCKYIKYCAGDCLKHRLFQKNNPETLSWLCEGWKQFYSHTLSHFEEVADSIKRDSLLGRE